MSKAKNICPKCGGPLVIEYFGSYGSVYKINRDGTESKRRLRRIMYEESGGDAIIYCDKCKEELNADT